MKQAGQLLLDLLAFLWAKIWKVHSILDSSAIGISLLQWSTHWTVSPFAVLPMGDYLSRWRTMWDWTSLSRIAGFHVVEDIFEGAAMWQSALGNTIMLTNCVCIDVSTTHVTSTMKPLFWMISRCLLWHLWAWSKRTNCCWINFLFFRSCGQWACWVLWICSIFDVLKTKINLSQCGGNISLNDTLSFDKFSF